MNYGKNAIKVGDVLHGYYCGHGMSRKQPYHSFVVAKVGNKYFYDKHENKYNITFDKRYFPQSNDLIAEDSAPNHRYKYYQTEEAAKRARNAYELKFKLNSFNFHSVDDHAAFRIAELLKIGRK